MGMYCVAVCWVRVADWCFGRTYLTGYAAQGTYWNEGYGGNVTTMANGKYYKRTEPWAFPITRMVG
jgi:hypothetical protein